MKIAIPIGIIILIIGIASAGDNKGGDGTGPGGATAQSGSVPPKVQIAKIARGEFGDQFKSVDITKQIGGGYLVQMEYNEDEDLSAELTRETIRGEMLDAYEALFTTPGLDVNEASILANVKVVDNLGNESYGTGWKTQMSARVGHKVNWSNARDLGLTPWQTVLLHPELQG